MEKGVLIEGRKLLQIFNRKGVQKEVSIHLRKFSIEGAALKEGGTIGKILNSFMFKRFLKLYDTIWFLVQYFCMF